MVTMVVVVVVRLNKFCDFNNDVLHRCRPRQLLDFFVSCLRYYYVRDVEEEVECDKVGIPCSCYCSSSIRHMA